MLEGTCAILTRTNAQLAVFETLCVEKGIKFHLLGRSGFWTQPEIKQLVHLMEFVLSPRPAINYPQELVAPLRHSVRSMEATRAVKAIIDRAQMESLYADEDYEDNDNFAITNLRTAVRIAEKFDKLSDFLKHAHRASHASRKTKNALTLGTIHAAKGLEWNNVFLAGVQNEILPHKKGEPDEERRIFYVGISRAAKRLRLSWSGSPSEYVIKYLTPEIKAKLQDNQERLQKQTSLFGG